MERIKRRKSVTKTAKLGGYYPRRPTSRENNGPYSE
jgi:hypothetical protein